MKLAALSALALLLAGCGSDVQRVPPLQVWPDMKWQVKPYPQGASTLFSDGRAARRPVEDTVARGYVAREDVYLTGISNNQYVGKNLEPLTPELMKLGQAKFNIYCTPCHSRVGDGKGIVALRTPAWQPSNLHEQRVREQADGQIYNTISFGRRTMPSYRFQITDHDRWAIVAYVRALQRTDGAVGDVPESLRANLR
jgi:mono/diheme cytochrome c family protein